MKISVLKKDALSNLSGKWGTAIVINLVFIILSFALNMISGLVEDEMISSLIALFIAIITLPFSFGLLASMIKLSRGENTGIMDFVTVGLANIGKVFSIYLRLILKLWLPIVLFFASIALVGLGAFLGLAGTISTEVLLVLMLAGSVIAIIASILYITKSLLYSLALYLLHDNPNATAKELLEKSAELMKGNRWKLILVELSFFGWYILIGFVSGIATAFLLLVGPILLYAAVLILMPYVTFTLISFYEHVAGIEDVKEVVAEGAQIDDSTNNE